MSPYAADDNYVAFRQFKTYSLNPDPSAGGSALIADPEGTIIRPDFVNNKHIGIYWYEKYQNGGYTAIGLLLKEICNWPNSTVSKMIIRYHRPSADAPLGVSAASPNIPMGQNESPLVSMRAKGFLMSFKNIKLGMPITCGCFKELGPAVAAEGQWGQTVSMQFYSIRSDVVEVGGIAIETLKDLVSKPINNLVNGIDGPRGSGQSTTNAWRLPLVGGSIEAVVNNSPRISREEYIQHLETYDTMGWYISTQAFQIEFNQNLPNIRDRRWANTPLTYDQVYGGGNPCVCCNMNDILYAGSDGCNGVCLNDGISVQFVIPAQNASVFVKTEWGTYGTSPTNITPGTPPVGAIPTTIQAVSDLITVVNIFNGNQFIPTEFTLDEYIEEYGTTLCNEIGTLCGMIQNRTFTPSMLTLQCYVVNRDTPGAIPVVTGIGPQFCESCITQEECIDSFQIWSPGSTCEEVGGDCF
jgi:hypothetical protein